MRSFFGQPANLAQTGPLIRVKFVAPTQNTGPDRYNTPSVDAVALIDTGADTTSIPYGTATRLGLTAVEKRLFAGFGNPVSQPHYMYRVRFLLPHAEGEVTACEELYKDAGAPYDCLIGRDILKHGLLFYDGTNNTFSLIF